MKTGITVHMMVKNEDQWIRYSLLSILPYVDHVLVTDTGSTDHTLEAIAAINSPKIKLSQTTVKSAKDITRVRQQQLASTTTDWIWIVDGDEIYSQATAQEVLRVIQSGQYEGVVVRRYDLLGDIYHRQRESVGSYNIFGHHGHLVTRALNKTKIKGLHYSGSYPNEGFFDDDQRSTREHDPKAYYITHNYLYHAMYLKRSSLGANLSMVNRGKYKVESGILVESQYPEVFDHHAPLSWETDPRKRRSLLYETIAAVITPIKQLKRKVI